MHQNCIQIVCATVVVHTLMIELHVICLASSYIAFIHMQSLTYQHIQSCVCCIWTLQTLSFSKFTSTHYFFKPSLVSVCTIPQVVNVDVIVLIHRIPCPFILQLFSYQNCPISQQVSQFTCYLVHHMCTHTHTHTHTHTRTHAHTHNTTHTGVPFTMSTVH